MIQAILDKGQFMPAAPTGASDGGHVEFACSSCGKPLADIWVTRPEASMTWKITVECCYCGDASWEQEVHGLYHFGGHAILNPNDLEDAKMVTVVTDVHEDGNKILFKTKRANA